MSSIEPLGSAGKGLQPLSEISKTPGEAAASPTMAASPAVIEGVKVSLSSAGMLRAASRNSNQDIEDSGLPQQIQQVLKLIRKLKQQIAEKLAQIQATQTNQRLSPEEIRGKVNSQQADLVGLNAGLLTANAALTKALKQSALNPGQLLQAAALATSGRYA